MAGATKVVLRPAIPDVPVKVAPTRQDTEETTSSTCSIVTGSWASIDVADDLSSDHLLIKEGARLCEDDQLLPGCRLLLKVKDKSVFNDSHKEWLRRYDLMVNLRKELMAPTYEGWKKQGESHGNRDFIVYYKTEDGGKLKCRIESVIESSLYVPFLSVMNETDLYSTWFPTWSFPFKLGISRSIKLKQRGRCEQVVQLTVDLPFPMNKREIVFFGFAEEDGEANRDVGVKLVTVDQSFDGGTVVPPPDKGIVRMNFGCDFLFRPCPDDHPALLHSKAKYPPGESKILLTTVLFCDPKVNFIPHSFLNFVTRNVIGMVWNMILSISEQVRAGTRPAHAEIIASKKDFYDWLAERARNITGKTGE